MRNIQSTLLRKQLNILHTFTTRQYGMSKTPYLSNNIAFHVGDDYDDVLRNHKVLADELSYDMNRLTHMRQIHSDKVLIIDETFSFDGPPECDAIITDIKEKPLMVMTADCTPLLFYDPTKGVIAAIHAGRAGAFKDIVTKTVTKMQDVFQSDPLDTIAVLGPSIGVCCYEVNREIEEEAYTLGVGYAMKKESGRYFLDVNAILRTQLSKVGIAPENLDDLSQCTSCHNDRFFSYRADGKQTGRMAGVIMLK